MTQTGSIREYLIHKDAECWQTFNKLDKLISSLLADNHSVRYKCASAMQSIAAFNQINELVSTGALNVSNPIHLSQYNNELAVVMRLFLYDKGKA
jgi:hypothetical protein